jgi:hypothetical protein
LSADGLHFLIEDDHQYGDARVSIAKSL